MTEPPPAAKEDEARTLRERLMALGAEQGFDEAQVQAAVKGKTGRRWTP